MPDGDRFGSTGFWIEMEAVACGNALFYGSLTAPIWQGLNPTKVA